MHVCRYVKCISVCLCQCMFQKNSRWHLGLESLRLMNSTLSPVMRAVPRSKWVDSRKTPRIKAKSDSSSPCLHHFTSFIGWPTSIFNTFEPRVFSGVFLVFMFSWPIPHFSAMKNSVVWLSQLKSQYVFQTLPCGIFNMAMENDPLVDGKSHATQRCWPLQHNLQGTSQSPWPKILGAGSSCESVMLSSDSGWTDQKTAN